MSLTPEPGPTPPATWTITLDLSRLPGAATATGVGLLAAAVVTSAIFLRRHDHVDGSVLTVGLLAVLGLLVVSVVAGTRYPGLEGRASLASWPAAAAFAGAGLLVAVLTDDGKSTAYLSSALVFVPSLACYLVSRARAFIVTGLISLGILYGIAFGDLFIDDGDNVLMIIGAGMLLFIAGVTGLGWLVPEDRAFIGVLAGALGIYTIFSGYPFIGAFGFFAYGMVDEPGGGYHNPYENDLYAVLGYCAVLVALWALCSALTGHVGFRVLIIALTVLAVPGAMLGLGTGHPTWWALGLVVLGVAALAFAALRSPDAPVSSS